MRSPGRYATCATPTNGIRWCSHSEWNGIPRGPRARRSPRRSGTSSPRRAAAYRQLGVGGGHAAAGCPQPLGVDVDAERLEQVMGGVGRGVQVDRPLRGTPAVAIEDLAHCIEVSHDADRRRRSATGPGARRARQRRRAVADDAHERGAVVDVHRAQPARSSARPRRGPLRRRRRAGARSGRARPAWDRRRGWPSAPRRAAASPPRRRARAALHRRPGRWVSGVSSPIRRTVSIRLRTRTLIVSPSTTCVTFPAQGRAGGPARRPRSLTPHPARSASARRRRSRRAIGGQSGGRRGPRAG